MIKQTGKAMRICMCCGERKEIRTDATYCDDCSKPITGGLFGETTDESKGLYTINTLRPSKS